MGACISYFPCPHATSIDEEFNNLDDFEMWKQQYQRNTKTILGWAMKSFYD